MKSADNKKKRSSFRIIINAFIVIGISVVFLLIAFVGFTQTKYFREYFREEVISIINENINGEFYVEKIDGSLFTSLILRNAYIKDERDTIIKARKLEAFFNPLQLFLKKIQIRKFALEETKIALVSDSLGVLNIEKLFPGPAKEDSSSGAFSFKIQVKDFSLKNLDFLLCDFKSQHDLTVQPVMNMKNLRINNLQLESSALIDFKRNHYEAEIGKFSFSTNISELNLKNLKGALYANTDALAVQNFTIKTEHSDLSINALWNNYNIFEGNADSLANSRAHVNLLLEKFDFDDLSAIIEDVNILKGNLKLSLIADGIFNDISINKLNLEFGETNLALKGRLKELNTPESLYIKAEINNSKIYYPNVDSLLPALELPNWDILLDKFTANYEGTVTNFIADVESSVENGNLKAEAKLNFDAPVELFDIKIDANKLDLNSLLGVKTELNLKTAYKGTGFSPSVSNSTLDLECLNSYIGAAKIDSMKATILLNPMEAFINANVLSQKFIADIVGTVNYPDKESPSYNLFGMVKNFNPAVFMTATNMEGDVDLSFEMKGKGFNLNDLTSDIKIKLDKSVLFSKEFDSTEIALSFIFPQNASKKITIGTEYFDCEINGKFDLLKFVDIFSIQSKSIALSIERKINEFNPLALIDDSLRLISQQYNISEGMDAYLKIDDTVDINYKFNLKNFNKITTFIGRDDVNFRGNISGRIRNNNVRFALSLLIDLDYLRFGKGEDAFFFSDALFSFNFSRDNEAIDFNNFSSELSLSVDRIFSAVDFSNVSLKIRLEDEKASYSVSMQADTIVKTQLEGYLDIRNDLYDLVIDKLSIIYNEDKLLNKEPIRTLFSANYFEIKNLTIIAGKSILDLKGKIDKDGKQNIKLSIIDGEVNSFLKYLMEKRSEFNANINLSAVINGTIYKPLVSLEMNMSEISYGVKKFGKITADFNYIDKMLSGEIKFIDTLFKKSGGALDLKCAIPIDLSFSSDKIDGYESKELNIYLSSQEFNLSAFGDVLPGVNIIDGQMFADLKIMGARRDLEYSGGLKISNCVIIAKDNNLKYIMNAGLSIRDGALFVDEITVENERSAKYKGKLKGVGRVGLESLKFDDIDLQLSGDLMVLGKESKAVNPMIYGDVFIQTDGTVNYIVKNGLAQLKGKVLLKRTELTFAQLSGSGGEENEDFIFEYYVDKRKKKKEQETELDRFISLTRKSKTESLLNGKSSASGLNYDITLKIDNEALFVFILSRELNQRLSALLSGEIVFEKSGGFSNAQGEFNLLKGSTLEFIKTFDAEGKITFESGLNNPRLNIIATYTGNYILPIDSLASTTKEVAVKIKLKGYLDEINKNFAKEKDNIQIFIGAEAIQNNIPDPTKDASDAASFIITGKFKEDLTAQDKTRVLQTGEFFSGAATSMLGSALTSFGNMAFGDYVKSVGVRQSDRGTQLSISGSYENIRYTIGGFVNGTEETSRDISSLATFKVEYSIDKNFSIRLERRDPILETRGNAEKINEIGVKYKLEF